jgi:hypothetical protein
MHGIFKFKLFSFENLFRQLRLWLCCLRHLNGQEFRGLALVPYYSTIFLRRTTLAFWNPVEARESGPGHPWSSEVMCEHEMSVFSSGLACKFSEDIVF